MSVRTSSSVTPPYVSGVAIDLDDGVESQGSTVFSVSNPLDTVDFIYQILDTFTGKVAEADLIRDLSEPSELQIVFQASVPNLKYRLFLTRIV